MIPEWGVPECFSVCAEGTQQSQYGHYLQDQETILPGRNSWVCSSCGCLQVKKDWIHPSFWYFVVLTHAEIHVHRTWSTSDFCMFTPLCSEHMVHVFDHFSRHFMVFSDGAQLCGLYIAASNILDMIENKDEVDLFYVAQQIKAVRPEFIQNEVFTASN